MTKSFETPLAFSPHIAFTADAATKKSTQIGQLLFSSLPQISSPSLVSLRLTTTVLSSSLLHSIQGKPMIQLCRLIIRPFMSMPKIFLAYIPLCEERRYRLLHYRAVQPTLRSGHILVHHLRQSFCSCSSSCTMQRKTTVLSFSL